MLVSRVVAGLPTATYPPMLFLALPCFVSTRLGSSWAAMASTRLRAHGIGGKGGEE